MNTDSSPAAPRKPTRKKTKSAKAAASTQQQPPPGDYPELHTPDGYRSEEESESDSGPELEITPTKLADPEFPFQSIKPLPTPTMSASADLSDPVIQATINSAVQAALAQRDTVESQPRAASTIASLRTDQDVYLPEPPKRYTGKADHGRVRYPAPFSDHDGDVMYEAWKMDMKFLIDDNPQHFDTNSKQAAAYFKGSAGTAKGLLLPLLKTSHPQYI